MHWKWKIMSDKQLGGWLTRKVASYITYWKYIRRILMPPFEQDNYMYINSLRPVDRIGNSELGRHGPLTRYVKLQVAHAPGMPGTSPPPPPPPISHDARAVMHVGIAYLRWRGKRSRHSRRMHTRNFAYLARGPLIKVMVCHICSTPNHYPNRNLTFNQPNFQQHTSVKLEPKSKHFETMQVKRVQLILIVNVQYNI